MHVHNLGFKLGRSDYSLGSRLSGLGARGQGRVQEGHSAQIHANSRLLIIP